MKRVFVILGFLSIVTLICIRSNQGKQDSPSNLTELKKTCENALGLFAKGENEQGLSLLRNHLVRSSPDDEWRYFVKTTDEQIKKVNEQFGKPIDYELIEEKKISDSLQRYIYVVKLEHSVMRFKVVFYRAQESWKILEVNYNTDLKEILD